MKFLQTLLEAPLPDDWDKGVFKSRSPFSKQLKYALERANEVGRGSARVAFEIPYQGRKTVLKIALNRKGLAQNEEEVRILSDKNIQKLGLTIPMIDFDEENTQPKWIHVEYGEEVTDSKLEQYFSIPSDSATSLERFNWQKANTDILKSPAIIFFNQLVTPDIYALLSEELNIESSHFM